MSLCTTCQSLDLLNAPKLPASCNAYSAKNESAALISVYKRGKAQTEGDGNVDEPLGLAFHQTLEDLHAAATHCSVCKVVEQDISCFQTEFNDPENAEQHQRMKEKGPDWKMWLAKGVNDISGFMVVSVDTQNKSVVWVLSAVGLYVDDDDPLSNTVTGRKIHVDPLSETTIRRALGWIEQCNSDHSDSKCLVADAALPPRVLDVNGTYKHGVSLHISQGEKGKYAALSHVSETESLYKLTGGSLETRQDGLDLNVLPQTFQDAITITRKLGLQYLWIDALCISPEDDLPEWSRSSPHFASIYTNAYITLSATSSPSSTHGMLTTRSPPPSISFPYTHTSMHGTIYASPLNKEHSLYPNNYKILSAEPLSQHAWALQERLLSPRILHLTSTQLYFECNAAFVSETGFKMQGRTDTLDPATRSFPSDVFDDAQRAHMLWHTILDLYCRRKPARPQDKLPALANLAARLAPHMGGDAYVAGLWRSRLVEELVWQATGHAKGRRSEAAVYRAPSWSWASSDGPFGMFSLRSGVHEREWRDLAEVRDCQVTLVKQDEPYGEVQSGWIRMCAPLEELVACEEAPRKQVWKMRTANGEEGGTICIFDTLARAERARSVRLYALLLAEGRKAGGGGNRVYHGIVVAPVSGEEGTYTRMGKVVFDDETLGKCGWMEDHGKMEDVRLV